MSFIQHKIIVIMLFLFSGLTSICFADAGLLSSVTSGPSPVIADKEHPFIEMTAEEVVIEITSRYEANITAGFLFTNKSENEEIVYMAIPIEVSTAFAPFMYNVYDMDSILDRPVVLVDGKKVTVKLLSVDYFSQYTLRDLSWEEFSDSISLIFPEQPEFGSPFYFRNVCTPGFLMPQAALAYWEVKFKPNEKHLVEYSEQYTMTAGYEDKLFRLSYPLFTGATWSGPIEYGKITIIPGEKCNLENVSFYYGIGLPEPRETTDLHIDINSYISSFDNFEDTKLAEYNNNSYPNAIIWEFKDLEPSPSTFSFLSFFPDIGNIGGHFGDSNEIDEYHTDNPWIHSQVYLLIDPNKPGKFIVVNPEGTYIYDNPDGEILEDYYIKPGSFITPIQWQDKWIYSVIRISNNIKYKGWVPIYFLDENGIVIPILMPYIQP